VPFQAEINPAGYKPATATSSYPSYDSMSHVDRLNALERLAKMKAVGAFTDEEFQNEKAKIMSAWK
jgi:hypothetical protein